MGPSIHLSVHPLVHLYIHPSVYNHVEFAKSYSKTSGLLLAEKPLAIGGFAEAPRLSPSWVDAFVVELVEVGGKFKTIWQLAAKDDVRGPKAGAVRGSVAVCKEGADNFVVIQVAVCIRVVPHAFC